MPAVAIFCAVDDVFDSVFFVEDAEVAAPEEAAVGVNGLRSALRKAATPALVLS